MSKIQQGMIKSEFKMFKELDMSSIWQALNHLNKSDVSSYTRRIDDPKAGQFSYDKIQFIWFFRSNFM